jgi:hypothetical protein
MAEDPKKKKAAPKPPPTPVADDSSNTDYDAANAQLAASLRGSGGTSEAQPEAPHPVQGFWDRLVHGVDGKSRTGEIVRSVGRGLVNAVTETGDTIAEGAAYVDRKTGLGEKLTPGFNAAYDSGEVGGKGTFTENADGENVSSHYLGNRSDDPLASFAESATQFTASYAALGSVKGFGALGKVGSALTKGAIVDATVFDPYEAQLAELAAKAPVPIVKQLGEVLSVKGDDGQVVARLKRAVAGTIPAAAIEGLVAVARSLRSAKVFASGDATAAEKTAAHETFTTAQQTVQDVADGTHVPEEAHVTVKPTDEGFVIEHAQGDAMDGVKGSASPVYQDQGEAQMQATTINMGLTARENVGKLDEGSASLLTESVASPEKLDDLAAHPEQLDGLAGSYQNTAEDDAKLVSDLAERINKALPGIRQGDNTLADADVTDLAKKMLGYVPEDRALNVVGELHGSDGRIQSVTKVMAELVAGAKQRQLAKMSELIDARPHDPVLVEESVKAVQNYFEFIHKFGMVESDAARMLRLAQQRTTLRAEDVKFSGQLAAPEHTAAVASTKTAVQDVADAVEKIGKNLTDTNAVSAADFSLSRARKAVEAALKKIEEGDKSFEHDPELAVQRAEKIKEGADAQRADPLSLTPEEQAAAKAVKTKTENPIERLSHLLDQVENHLDATLEKSGAPKGVRNAPRETTPLQDLLRKNKDEQAAQQGFNVRKVKDAPTPIEGLQTSEAAPAGEAAAPVEGLDTGFSFDEVKKEVEQIGEKLKTMKPTEVGTPKIAGMASRDASAMAVDKANVAAKLRMIRMGGGGIDAANALVRATAVQWNKSLGAKIYEFYANSLLSGVKTLETIGVSGVGVSTMEPIFKATAGALTGNKAMMQEGADILYGNFAYLKENLQASAAAWRAGRSIIDPVPPHYAIGGVTGTIVRTPGRAVGMLDEFLTATNYRSYVRAKSLRLGREQGLEGAALDARVAEDLRNAYDPQTGIATIPEALRYAEVPSFKQPLGGGFGKGWQNFAQDNLTVRFITPFVKAPVNIFRYVLDGTPLLNMVAKRNRDIIREGGEAAALLHTRSAYATALYGYGFMQARAGNLTGRGPSDPELRKLWLEDHQPYSIKVGGTWVSYRRFDPLGMPLGLIADFHTFASEMGDKDQDAEHYGAAVVASITQNLLSRSYMSGLAEFMDAASGNNPNKVIRYGSNFIASAIPAGVAALNPDPYYRETQGLIDGLIARVPGYSETLMPRFNAFGEKALKADGVLNRGANMAQLMNAKPDKTADRLLELKKALPAFSEKLDTIDLTDKSLGDGKQVRPYERLMQLVRHPEDGRPSLRQAFTELVNSDKWAEGTNGAHGFPGGDRYIYAKVTKEAYEQRALKQVLSEYPKLSQKWRDLQRAKGAAIQGGDTAVNQLLGR